MAVPYPLEGVFPVLLGLSGDIDVEPFHGGRIVRLAEMAICDAVRNQRELRLPVKSRHVIKVSQYLKRLVITVAPVVRFSKPETRELIEPAVPVRIICSHLKARDSHAPRPVGNKLACPQVIGFHIIVPHALVQLIYHSISVNSSRVVTVMQGGHGDIIVNAVIFLTVRIFADISAEHGRVIIYVKSKLSPVEMRILCDFRVKRSL